MRAALALALALAIAIPSVVDARGPVRVDLADGAPIPCHGDDGQRLRTLCLAGHVTRAMGIGFVYFPPEQPGWGLVRIRAPGYAANEITDGIVCFADTIETIAWDWTGVETAVSTGFWFATPRGVVSVTRSDGRFRRRVEDRRHAC